MDMFIDGAHRGFTIATTNLLPNVVMAFVIDQALKITGLLDWVGHICQPVMWRCGGFRRSGYGASGFADEYGRRRWRGGQSGATAGALSGHDTVLLPAIYLMETRYRMSAAVSVLPKSTPNITAYYRSLRHQCAAVDLGHAAYCLIGLSCLIYPPPEFTLLQGCAPVCARRQGHLR